MNKEIGSEFWNAGPVRKDNVYLLSGRTALEFIIRDILREHHIETVLIPSYCCHTMIEPFCRHGINVRFYDVYFDSKTGLTAEVPEVFDNEIFYYMTYFGFQQLSGIYIEKIKSKAKVIIEDRTHSWLSGESLENADYSYASFRKWTGFSGIAQAVKYQGDFYELPININLSYCGLRRKASKLKQTYIEGHTGDKQKFLSLFGEAEELLEKDYINYLPEPETVSEFLNFDKVEVCHKRRRNAELLIDGLKGIDGVRLIFPQLANNDVPLFVPILIENGRTELKQHLIQNSIFCPMHWPLSEYHCGISRRAESIYSCELSLVCDQRYDETDMERLVSVINDFFMR